jgi:hypothetical protein
VRAPLLPCDGTGIRRLLRQSLPLWKAFVTPFCHASVLLSSFPRRVPPAVACGLFTTGFPPHFIVAVPCVPLQAELVCLVGSAGCCQQLLGCC